MILIIFFSILLAIFGACSALVVRYLGAVHVSEADLIWFQDFSVERYRPMERLLAGSDHRFYCAQIDPARGNFSLVLIREWWQHRAGRASRNAFYWCSFRATRRGIFREYLRNLVRDFKRLHAIAGTQLPVLQTVDPQISITLFKLRFSFAFACALIEIQLAVDFFRLSPIEVWPLLEYLNGLNTQLRWCGPGLPQTS